MNSTRHGFEICEAVLGPHERVYHLLALQLLLHSIYEKIGKGKHSTVYKGRKKKTIQYHAIKSVDKSQKPRVLQEVGCSATLHTAWCMVHAVQLL